MLTLTIITTAKKKDSIVSKKAFIKAYSVLMHPRCMNCHPAGDAPLQGDDSHVHAMNVKRGPDGKGLYALKVKKKNGKCDSLSIRPGVNVILRAIFRERDATAHPT